MTAYFWKVLNSSVNKHFLEDQRSRLLISMQSVSINFFLRPSLAGVLFFPILLGVSFTPFSSKLTLSKLPLFYKKFW